MTIHPTTSAPPRPVLAAGAWMLGAVAFPVAGLLAGAVAGPVTTVGAALAGGAVTGAVIGLGQGLAALGRLPRLRWVIASTAGTALGLATGATAVGFSTAVPALVSQGLLTGAALGLAQAAVLPAAPRDRAVWFGVVAALWAAGWTVTTLIGVDVERHYTVFGASGAAVVTALSGLALHLLLPAAGRR